LFLLNCENLKDSTQPVHGPARILAKGILPGRFERIAKRRSFALRPFVKTDCKLKTPMHHPYLRYQFHAIGAANSRPNAKMHIPPHKKAEPVLKGLGSASLEVIWDGSDTSAKGWR